MKLVFLGQVRDPKIQRKKVAMLYMFGHHPSSLRKHGSGKGKTRKKEVGNTFELPSIRMLC
jgi:hypothetical protein